jgi:hypothetical protein
MKQILTLVVGLLLVPQPDAARVLADVRQALGGDAAIAAVQAFSVTGTQATNLDGRTAGADIEWICALPDRFIRTRRIGTPFGTDVDTVGFSADARIRRRDSDLPAPPDPFEHDTPDQRAERDRRAVLTLKHEFSRLAVALVGLPAVDPLDATYEGRRDIDGGSADVVQLGSSDGYSARLFVDASTHLPLMVSWMAAPIVVVSSSARVAVPAGQSPNTIPLPVPVVPRGDPTAGRAPVEHQLWFEDFKISDGLTWPHRFVEKVDGHVWQTTSMGKYKLNPKIDPKQFDPSRRP